VGASSQLFLKKLVASAVYSMVIRKRSLDQDMKTVRAATLTKLLSFPCFLSLWLAASGAVRAAEPGFVNLFDGQSLNGWTLVGKHGEGYGVKNGVIFCAKGGGGNLFTEKEYADFIFRFEFKLEEGSNNGVGIRAPLEGDAAYAGMEIQILEEGAAKAGKWGKLRPEQFHGSIYGVVPAKLGALKPPGQWNDEEITAQGRQVKVVVNGRTILDANLNHVGDLHALQAHPGLLRERGHIGFLGHNDYLEFRNVRVKELPSPPEKDNSPPPGFRALFNGKNLSGWKGLLAGPYDNPIKRAALSPTERAAKQKEADENMRAHWQAEDGALVFDGKGRSLCTGKDYANFEFYVDWKIPPHGDSGIYLRGSPQVQIWDPYTKPTSAGSEVGSGGLYNNQKNPSKPLGIADKPIGEWNRFHVLMMNEKVHVFLNGQLVVNDVTLENYWDRTQPIFPVGQIELQNHGGHLWFKNVYLRELPSKP
jgi:3-keto-disaccharide hydrolase